MGNIYGVSKHRDTRGAGGNIATGFRIVRKGGRILFDRFWHSNVALESFIGEEVEVQAEDAFFNKHVAIFYNYKFICYAANEYKKVHSESN